MNSPQNKIFVLFGILAIPFGVLQTWCKIQKCKKTIFWCLRNPCENTFSKLPMFFLYIKKERSKHVRVLAVCNTQENIFYIFVETPTSQLDVNMKMESSKPSYIL